MRTINMPMCEDDDGVALMRLLQLADSALPVGTFSFSNGLETAAAENLVRDTDTLEAYVRALVQQAACTDGVAALCAHRSATEGSFEKIIEADHRLFLMKMNAETRQMQQRMGKKMAELNVQLFGTPLAWQWLDHINAGHTPGTYPVAQGIAFALIPLPPRALFGALLYGQMSMVLNAALRCVRVSHLDTQRILFRLGHLLPPLYEEVRPLGLDDMHAFAPQIDLFAALHEQGTRRMFMN